VLSGKYLHISQIVCGPVLGEKETFYLHMSFIYIC